MKTLRKLQSRCRGQALIEFSLCILVFLILWLGMLDFAWGILAKQQITSAVREGARFGMTNSRYYKDVEYSTHEAAIRQCIGDHAGRWLPADATSVQFSTRAPNQTLSAGTGTNGSTVIIEAQAFVPFLTPIGASLMGSSGGRNGFVVKSKQAFRSEGK